MTTGDMDRPGDAERPGSVDDAVWTELVASFHASAADRRGEWPDAENLPADRADEAAPDLAAQVPGAEPAGPTTSRVVRPARSGQSPANPPAPAVTSTGVDGGPRDWERPAHDSGDDRYQPPVPPPLPELDMATKAAWTAGLGGPGYLALSTFLHWDTPQWAALLCVMAGIVGFGYLVTKLKDRPDDEDDDRAVL